MTDPALREQLAAIVGSEHLLEGERRYEHDASLSRGLRAVPDAVVRPASTAEVAQVVSACLSRGVPVVPRGRGTGFAGGAVATSGGIVLTTERMTRVRSFDPLLWRMEVEAGLTTRDVQRLARENGLLFPPDPGAAEESHIGGNVATNAGGPHAFKYGTTGAWVTGVEAVVAPGRVVRLGGPLRKDVAGYDLGHLLVGSEGTLGVITAVWLRLIPRPEASLPVVALYPGAVAGAAAVQRVLGSGIVPAALDYLDAATLAAAGATMPVPSPSGFALLVELDGEAHEVERGRGELLAALEPGATGVHTPPARELWAWREGVSIAVTAQRGGKLSEDIAVPVEHLAEAVEGVVAIGGRHGLPACSWGHAGDGNLHATFMIDAADAGEVARGEEAAAEVFALADRLGGSVSGEHGVGYLKREHVGRRWSDDERALQAAVKHAFDPQGLMNPGKKLPA
ncbi:MAG: FAD-binding protein [Solirubrobacterales bacterium]|nr:FAD-binding protein [Solirubrobacterales bacterium]